MDGWKEVGGKEGNKGKVLNARKIKLDGYEENIQTKGRVKRMGRNEGEEMKEKKNGKIDIRNRNRYQYKHDHPLISDD